jgi:hypothetical protein
MVGWLCIGVVSSKRSNFHAFGISMPDVVGFGDGGMVATRANRVLMLETILFSKITI